MRIKLGRPDLAAYAARFDVPPAAGDFSVTFLGVSSLLFDDGESAVLTDGFFSRPSLLKVGLGKVAPDRARIGSALTRLGLDPQNGGRGLDAVVPVHTHFDHAMDSPTVAQLTGAVLIGGESAANVGRGAGLPDDRIHVVTPGEPVSCGAFTLTLLESEHCPPDRFPGIITEPVVPPARATAYKCGEAWSIRVEHTSGRTALVQGSAGAVPGALDGRRADVAYLGVGQLGIQDEDYIRTYWARTVQAVGARRVVLTHWDDFFRPLDEPLRALPYAGDDLDVTLRVLARLAGDQRVALHLPTVWRREDPWVGMNYDRGVSSATVQPVEW
jgi:L-ascorbate metabolism protein UlaG (beta-lactamase superfamily)